MERERTLSCAQARQMDMVAILLCLGYEPVRVRQADYWYRSPLRNERTASFKINRKVNRWYDHGIGKGGNLIDFGILYYKCGIAEFLKVLSGNLYFQKPASGISEPIEPVAKIAVEQVSDIVAPPLMHYLADRGISIDIARYYCTEIHYRINNKNGYAIGFKNDSGGYELRNLYFKGSSTPKDVTTLINGSPHVAVFEGFFDFLSFETYNSLYDVIKPEYLILNSLSFFEKVRPFMEQHDEVLLFLDNDKAGQNCSRSAEKCSPKYIDKSSWYKGYKDLNDWLVQSSNSTGNRKSF